MKKIFSSIIYNSSLDNYYFLSTICINKFNHRCIKYAYTCICLTYQVFIIMWLISSSQESEEMTPCTKCPTWTSMPVLKQYNPYFLIIPNMNPSNNYFTNTKALHQAKGRYFVHCKEKPQKPHIHLVNPPHPLSAYDYQLVSMGK